MSFGERTSIDFDEIRRPDEGVISDDGAAGVAAKDQRDPVAVTELVRRGDDLRLAHFESPETAERIGDDR